MRKKETKINEHGEKGKVEKLIKKYQPRLKSFIQKRVSNNEDAEDILQDVFYQFVKAIDNNINPIEHVTAWLYRVARNTIINKGKKKQEENLSLLGYDNEENALTEFSKVLFNDDNPTPETEYLRSLVWQELEKALSELSPEQREVFELTELDGLPVKEIARNLDIPVNTLLSRKHYAVKYLRQRLHGLYKDILEQ
ncbi:MAG: RNA polymerase sigma factor [Acholeplasmataceae bacterium]|nr:RNA polymerase sigma factor [Acholeplasmataceae bacterium]